MARQTRRQKEIVGRVMHEFKHGELDSAGGRKVKNPRQAIAIGLSEAGASNRTTPVKNKRNQARTERKERAGQTAQQQKEGRRVLDSSRAAGRKKAASPAKSEPAPKRAAPARRPATGKRTAGAKKPSPDPRKSGAKSAPKRPAAMTRAALYREAQRRGLAGLSRASKDELAAALGTDQASR